MIKAVSEWSLASVASESAVSLWHEARLVRGREVSGHVGRLVDGDRSLALLAIHCGFELK